MKTKQKRKYKYIKNSKIKNFKNKKEQLQSCKKKKKGEKEKIPNQKSGRKQKEKIPNQRMGESRNTKKGRKFPIKDRKKTEEICRKVFRQDDICTMQICHQENMERKETMT